MQVKEISKAMTNIRLQNPYMDETIVVKEDCNIFWTCWNG